MRVVIVSPVFTPEPIVSAQTSAQLAEELVRRGCQVTVVTAFPSKPAGKLYPGYARRLIRREKMGVGFEVVRCFSFLSPQSRLVSRLLENVSFGMIAGWVVLTTRRPDVIYANTWPIVAIGILYLVARLRYIPLVISVQDVYPESLVVQRRVRAESWLIRWMRWWDGFIARGCQSVIVISERFAEVYRRSRKVQDGQIHLVPNWIDGTSVVIHDHTDNFRTERGIPQDAFLVVYGGNVSVAAGLETVIEAFRYLQDDGLARLLIAGEGSNLAVCQALAKQWSGARVSFHTPWPVEETSLVLRTADLLVLPTQGSQSTASVPSKLIYYMLAARPVIALASPQSDIARIVERSGCGWVVEPDQPEMLAAKIRNVMALERQELARCGEAGRGFALQHFTREACLPIVISILENAVSR